MTNPEKTITSILGVLAVLGVVTQQACAKKSPETAPTAQAAAPRPAWNDPSWDTDSQAYITLYTDGETGCQYFASGTRDNLSLSPRRGLTGQQICRKG